MSEREPETPIAPEAAVPPRRHYIRHILWTSSGVTILVIVAVIGFLFWASSAAFENIVRGRIVAALQTATGGRVEIASFHWHLFDLDAEASRIVIHGLEAPGEAPFARVDNLHARVSILGLWSPHILLRDLEITRPSVHLIVYADGSTNQPHPRNPSTPGQGFSKFFDLQAGHIGVQQGVLDYDNRAASFDFQNRFAPLDLAANDVSLSLAYVAAAGKNPESYRVDLGARDLSLVRGKDEHATAPAVQGYMQATLDMTRNAAYLRSLRITTHAKGAPDHTLEISGSLNDFREPAWHTKIAGDLDLRILEPATGYPSAPEGIARLDLAGGGSAGQFRIDGTVHATGAAYIQPGVIARGIGLDARVHADPGHLLITSVVARLPQGGQLEGEVLLDHWLPPIPGAHELAAAEPVAKHGIKNQLVAKTSPEFLRAPSPDLHTNGKVTAQFRSVPLDTVLDIVGQPPFQRLGLDAHLDGLTVANWTGGDVRTLSVSANLAVNPSGTFINYEVPTTGAIEGTYTQRDGAVDLRKLDVSLPSSHVAAHGRLGAYPLSSASAMNIDFQSHDLGEFDTVLRDLGLKANGKTGAAALPISLGGPAEFQGTWTGSLVDPHLAGKLQASNLDLLVAQTAGGKVTTPQSVRWDSIDASGSYSAARIAIDHGELRRGKASIDVDGTLAAASPPAETGIPAFDSDSVLHAHLRASNVNVDELRPFMSQNLPVAGTLSAQIDTDGPIHAMNGAGWVQLDGGSIYGEPVSRVHAQGKVVGEVMQLASVTITGAAGKVALAGSYDFKSRGFQLEARGAGIDIAKIHRVLDMGSQLSGNLGFNITGSGDFNNPRLEGHATLSGLTVGGDPFGGVEVVAHTFARNLIYDVTTKFDSTELVAHGQTALHDDYATQATLKFSRFNIGSLLKLAHVQALTGESALQGTITVAGPLGRPEELRGDANLQQMAATIAGVHLRSEGAVRATLVNSRISLDPLHITGEETDLNVRGSLGLKDKQPLDMAARGSINLKLAETIDPDLTASGDTNFQVEAHGTLQNPGLTGRIDFKNASLALEDLPNSLSQLHGTLEFNQDRLEVKSLTAMSGGGLLSVSGYLAYRHGIFADLSLTGKGIRIRYPQGVSSAADITLQLQGPQNNLLLSGGVLITRFTVSPDLDFVALAAHATKAQPITSTNAPSNHIRLDVRVQSSPQLNFQNAYAKLAGDVDLHVRGTLASPSLLGQVAITEGSATIAGTRYELQRGEITFNNPVRIQPMIDLNATARVEDYDITLGLHGSSDQMAVTYRSDPPLPEADVVALLALGRTQDQQRLYTQQQEQVASNPTTDALLGGALNATVSSRVQRLFGAGSVKVDPSYLGVLGNSTTRITVEEQLGKNLTLTYATDVDTTAQQLLQAEIAINRHVSLLVARDESGVFSMVVKATRRFR